EDEAAKAEEPPVEEPAEEPAPEPEPEPVAEEPTPAPTPVAEASEREPLPSLTPLEELPDDADVLKERFRDLERKFVEKAQEARAYEEALEAAHAGGGADDDGLGGFSDAVSGDLEQRVLDLQLVADEKTAEVLEKEDEIKALMREIDVLRSRSEENKDRAERERQAIAEDILKGHERLEVQKQEVAEAKAEVSEFETVNAELLLETEDLKERLGAMEHLLEVERAERGKLVRERLVSLRTEIERLENSNAELRTLVEAYEEKIDELDERVEELEGESEAHESLVSELREQLTKAQHERDTMVKTLRKKLQGLERKLELAKGENARARAAAEASTSS
ncbi:MAG TPA: hypothetical protein DEA08_31940, partial [Planctomycetes bacterium]|nr:hypothetical protein [Planctomycetota bacterium]